MFYDRHQTADLYIRNNQGIEFIFEGVEPGCPQTNALIDFIDGDFDIAYIDQEEMMNQPITTGIHWSFWVIAVVTLIWNVLGAMNFVLQMNSDVIASMSEAHRAIIEGRPAWATVAFAVAVFGGALGCILLLFKKAAAKYLFLASLIGVLAQLFPHINLVGSVISDPFEILMMVVLPIAVAVFLLWYAKYVERKNWIN